MSFPTATNVLKKLRDAGYQAVFAGGCVRDTLLGRTPHDYDIATNALPAEIEKLFVRTIPVGAQFGVIIVLESNQEIQVATFRSDGTYTDGRHPTSVTYTSAEEDAKRRDFTINGLFYDPIKDEVFDYVNGREDLTKKIIRAIGNPRERFQEDKLRLLRAIRFATTLGFTIDPATWEALLELAPEIHSVSAERIRDELQKILLSPNRLHGFDLLYPSGLLRDIIPDIELFKGCEQPPEFHPEGDVFVHTRLMISLLSPEPSLPSVLSVLFHDIGKPATRTVDPATGKMSFYGHDQLGATMTEKLLQRLRFPNEIIDAVIPAVRLHMSFKDVPKMRLSTLRRLMARPTFHDELELHRVDCTSSHGMLDNYELLKQKEVEFAQMPLIPPPLITGEDLINLGFAPGPEFGKILRAVKDRQLENLIATKEEALVFIQNEFKDSANRPNLSS